MDTKWSSLQSKHIDNNHFGVNPFADIEEHWGYFQILESCFSHDYKRDTNGFEEWTKIK
ncbi:MAG: hypothetical protein IKR04_07370 [Clostridia bacterium]|nr:hypothetical protein [Clostridia bacterium]